MSTKLVHTCSVCGKHDTWSDSWSWCFKIVKVHGFPHEEVVKFCNDNCLTKYQNENARKRNTNHKPTTKEGQPE
jgi:hypothetical protein